MPAPVNPLIGIIPKMGCRFHLPNMCCHTPAAPRVLLLRRWYALVENDILITLLLKDW